MRAIPKSLLIHSVEFREKLEEDRWGQSTVSFEQTLSCVRFEPSSKIVRTTNNSEVQLSAILIYDCTNSRPKNFEFKLDNIISFNNQKYRVVFIEPLYDNKKLHHYEIGLVKQV